MGRDPVSPAAQAVLAVVGILVWVVLAVLVAIAIGRSIRTADRAAAKPCCPHDVEEAPQTVRGEFRAIIPSQPDPRGARLDVRA